MTVELPVFPNESPAPPKHNPPLPIENSHVDVPIVRDATPLPCKVNAGVDDVASDVELDVEI